MVKFRLIMLILTYKLNFMKSWLNKSFLFFIAALTLMSCEKDEEMVILKQGQDATAPVLSASSNNIVLLEDNAKKDALTLKWNAADFGFNAAVVYTVEIDTAKNNFVKPATLVFGKSLEKKYTVEELNTLLTKLKYKPDVAHDIKFRVKADISDKVSPIYSNVMTLKVTPYSTFIEPSFIYVPGDYQGWNPGTAPALISVESNGKYKGIISFMNTSSREFKFTANRNWDLNYGKGASEGSLEKNGGNLTVPTEDTYLVEVDLNNLTWTRKLNSWGVIGSATPGGWDADTNLKYNNADDVWKLTVQLTAGKIKFRKNDDWGKNFGDDDLSNPALNVNGADIPIATAGTYEITFKINETEDVASYTVTKK
jgi:starch-binding outer membrane protein SusE/F